MTPAQTAGERWNFNWERAEKRHPRSHLREWDMKARIKYAEFLATQSVVKKEGTLAWVIERVINDVLRNPDMKQIGRTKMGRMRMLQRAPIAEKMAVSLNKHDYNEHIKARRRDDGIGGATATHDLVCISTSLAHYAATWDDLNLRDPIGELAMSKLFLAKNNVIAGSEPRTRLPAEEELRLILEECRACDARPKAKIKCMEDFVRAGHISGRRRGEVERMEHGDFFYEEEIYWVRDLKHPTKKEGNDKPFYLFPELAEIVKRQPRLDPNNPNERVFKRIASAKVNANSIGAKYCSIKNKLRKLHPGLFEDLRLHDNRGDRFTRLLDDGFTYDEVRDMASGHEKTSKALERSYDRRKASQRMRPAVEKLKAMLAQRNEVAA